MKKYLIGILLIISVLSFGCSSSPISYDTQVSDNNVTTTSSYTTNTTPKYVLEKISTSTTKQDPSYGDIDVFGKNENGEDLFRVGAWSLYGELDINNYRVGVDVNKKNVPSLQPFYIINRINEAVDRGVLGTEKNETTATIPLKNMLHDSDLNNIKSIATFYVEVDAKGKETFVPTGEAITASEYNNGQLTISGLTPNITRNIVITYVPDTKFKVEIEVGKTETGYEKAPIEIAEWTTIEPKYIVVEPDSYGHFYVNMKVPKGTTVPQNWEFWVMVSSVSNYESVGVMTQIRQGMPIRVNMAS